MKNFACFVTTPRILHAILISSVCRMQQNESLLRCKVTKRDSVSTDMCDMNVNSTDDLVVRELTMILLCFATFLDYDKKVT